MYIFRKLLFVSLIFTPTIALSSDENSFHLTPRSGNLSSLFPLSDTTASQNNTPNRDLPRTTLKKRKFSGASSLESIMMPSSSFFDETDTSDALEPSISESKPASENEIDAIENQIYSSFLDLDSIVSAQSEYDTELYLISLFSDIEEKKYEVACGSVNELIEMVKNEVEKANTDRRGDLKKLQSALQNLENYLNRINPFYFLDSFTKG